MLVCIRVHFYLFLFTRGYKYFRVSSHAASVGCYSLQPRVDSAMFGLQSECFTQVLVLLWTAWSVQPNKLSVSCIYTHACLKTVIYRTTTYLVTLKGATHVQGYIILTSAIQGRFDM